MRYEAQLSERQKDGAMLRDHLVKAATAGHARSRQILEGGPPCPEGFEYLREWAFRLHGRSGAGMGGLAPLSYGTIAAWSQFTGITPEPDEVDALIRLDGVLLVPGELKVTE